MLYCRVPVSDPERSLQQDSTGKQTHIVAAVTGGMQTQAGQPGTCADDNGKLPSTTGSPAMGRMTSVEEQGSETIGRCKDGNGNGEESESHSSFRARKGQENISAESSKGSEESSKAIPRKEHYWGQALQYLDRAVKVTTGKKVTLLVKRDGHEVR